MKLRILTALVLIPPVIYLIGWSPQWLFLVALVATVERGLYEYFIITRQAGLKAFPAVGYVAGGALCLAQAAELQKAGSLGFIVLVLIVLCTLAIALRWTSDLKEYLGATTSTISGVLYVAFSLSLLVPLRFSAHLPAWATGRKLMLLLFLVIWSDDVFAFLVGRLLGRTLLFPRVSPKKTVEGALAGLAGSLLVAWGFTHWFWQTANLKTIMVWAGLIAVAGQVGDLVESAMKRGANLKDAGDLLPGHGGLLDRIDSLIFGAPTLWLALAVQGLWMS